MPIKAQPRHLYPKLKQVQVIHIQNTIAVKIIRWVICILCTQGECVEIEKPWNVMIARGDVTSGVG